MPLVTGVTLHAQAEELLHRNQMHPSYVYRSVMCDKGSEISSEHEPLPVPTEDDGWERNPLADNPSDPDIDMISWRKMLPIDQLDAIAELHKAEGMHYDTAVLLLRRHGSKLRTDYEYTLPLRMGALLLHYTEKHADLDRPRTEMSYQVRLKSGAYGPRQQWMPFVELPLSIEDFHYTFQTPAKEYLETHAEAMLGAFFPELDMSLGIEMTSYVLSAHANRGFHQLPKTAPRARTNFEKLTCYVQADNHCLDLLVVHTDETGTEFFPHFVGELWRRLSEQKVMIYALYDRYLEKKAQQVERAKYEYCTTVNHVQTGKPVRPDGGGWHEHDIQAGGGPKPQPGVSYWIRPKQEGGNRE